MRLPLMTAAAFALLAACAPAGAAGKGDTPPAKAAPAGPTDPTGFTHPAGAMLFGYYMPASEVKTGNWQLTNFHIGDEEGFKDWEAGRRTPTYAPIMLEFDDVTSPKATNELGGEYHTVSARILPDAYSISADGKVDFVDKGSRLGKVTFHGRFDMAALQAATRENADTSGTVLTGTLTVGDKTFENVSFTWFGGD